jgi:hypothetical protein
MLRGVKTRMVMLSSALVLTAACGGGQEYPTQPPRPIATDGEPKVPEGSLSRADVVEVVDAGLGAFLQQARVEPSLDEGRFVGFRIVELVGASFWGKADLRPGDVVTHLNGTFVEDPNQVYDAFEALREAPQVEVRYVRAGQARTLRFPIVGAPEPRKAEPGRVSKPD